MDTDNLLNTTAGLLAVGVLANVAGRAIGKSSSFKLKKPKKLVKKSKW